MLTNLWYYCDKRLGVVACLLPESSRRLLLFNVLFPVCPVDRRRVVPAMTLQSWCRWLVNTCIFRSSLLRLQHVFFFPFVCIVTGRMASYVSVGFQMGLGFGPFVFVFVLFCMAVPFWAYTFNNNFRRKKKKSKRTMLLQRQRNIKKAEKNTSTSRYHSTLIKEL